MKFKVISFFCKIIPIFVKSIFRVNVPIYESKDFPTIGNDIYFFFFKRGLKNTMQIAKIIYNTENRKLDRSTLMLNLQTTNS